MDGSKLWRRTSYVIGVLCLAGFLAYAAGSADSGSISYSEFKDAVASRRVEEVTVSPTRVGGRYRAAGDGRPAGTFETVRVDDGDLLRDLRQSGVKVIGAVDSSPLSGLFGWGMAVVLILTGYVLVSRWLRKAGTSGFMTLGRNKARIYAEKQVGVTLADVAGVDEAKAELVEVIEFLKTPEKFRRLGGKIPKGILLVGPPGTGKTLLARAVAGEAGVVFFSISGSEFVEMFVGVGAARVRDLFTQARAQAPCIIFIDELDALGKARGLGPMSHDEREQTLNQLLVELDGFDPRSGVILMAATNRPEILDPALLRAGRFDRHVLVDRPDRVGRLAILQVHARHVKLDRPADLEPIAAMTPGLVGADLANLINEAALLAVRRGKDAVGLAELQEAVERVIAGLEKRNRVLNRMEKERVAHHEVGHALVALALPGQGVVHKVSIIPRGVAALGYTLQLPTEDRFLMTQRELEDKIAMLFGGRAAEELIYDEISTGAQDDLAKATDIARSMVRSYGMSPRLGHLVFDRAPGVPYMEANGVASAEHGEETARAIDAEVKRILDEQYGHAKRLLNERLDVLRAAAAELLEHETLSGEELARIAERPHASTPAHAA